MRIPTLVDKARDGNQKAFKELFEQNFLILYRYLKQFSYNTDEVEEWVQTAFIKAFKYIHSFEGKSSFRTWLFKIAINEMRSDKRSAKNNFFSSNDFELAAETYENGDFEWREEMRWLVSELDITKKSVFILFEVEGYTHNEIAEMLEITENSSRTILHRTKKLLKEKWLSNTGELK